jgi:hypothetical protein
MKASSSGSGFSKREECAEVFLAVDVDDLFLSDERMRCIVSHVLSQFVTTGEKTCACACACALIGVYPLYPNRFIRDLSAPR